MCIRDRLTGLSTNEYVRKIRMKYAEQYLLEGKYNISEIAFKVGINNLFYFRPVSYTHLLVIKGTPPKFLTSSK